MTAWSFHTVGRGLGQWETNNAPLFGLGLFFNGLLASLDDPQTGRQTVRSILSWAAPDGFVPNFAHWNPTPPAIEADVPRSVANRRWGRFCVWKMHQRWPDVDFSREVYPKLVRWHAWCSRLRRRNHDGLLEWGSNGQARSEANYETGWTTRRPSRVRKWSANTPQRQRGLILIPLQRGCRVSGSDCRCHRPRLGKPGPIARNGAAMIQTG